MSEEIGMLVAATGIELVRRGYSDAVIRKMLAGDIRHFKAGPESVRAAVDAFRMIVPDDAEHAEVAGALRARAIVESLLSAR